MEMTAIIKFRNKLNKLCRGRLLSIYKYFGFTATNVLNGHEITFDPNTDIGGALFFNGWFERGEIKISRKYIKEDSNVLDIGANIGVHSICYASFASKGRVFSFEPAPQTFFKLFSNVKNIGNILPMNIGISDSKGVVPFFIASDDAYSGLADTKREKIVAVRDVICWKVDDFVSGLGLNSLDFVKIDVEGFELNVFNGMIQTIKQFKPVIFCEIYRGKASNPAPEKITELLMSMGYDVYIFNGTELIKWSHHDDKLYNYFFLPQGR